MELTGVSGSINGVDATAFTGTGAIVSLNSLASALFSVTSSVRFPGRRRCRREQRGHHARANCIGGRPSIDVDRTSGLFSDITLTGAGAGTAFVSHHGRSSDSLVVEQ